VRAFEPIRVGVALPNALVLAALLGGLYAAVEFHARSLYLRVGTAAVAAALLGALTAGFVRFGRVHNRGLAVILGTLVGMIGLWASWVIWVWLVLGSLGLDVSPLRLATDPQALFRLALDINTVGPWSYDSRVYRGMPLLIIWVGEALILVLGCTLVAAHFGKPGLFCAACRKACKPVTGLGRFDGTSVEDVCQRLEEHDFAYLLEIGPMRDDDDPEIRLELLCCPCSETNVLSARRVAWEDNGQGSIVLKERALVTGLLLSREQTADVKSLKGRMPAQDDLADGPGPGKEDDEEDEDDRGDDAPAPQANLARKPDGEV